MINLSRFWFIKSKIHSDNWDILACRSEGQISTAPRACWDDQFLNLPYLFISQNHNIIDYSNLNLDLQSLTSYLWKTKRKWRSVGAGAVTMKELPASRPQRFDDDLGNDRRKRIRDWSMEECNTKKIEMLVSSMRKVRYQAKGCSGDFFNAIGFLDESNIALANTKASVSTAVNTWMGNDSIIWQIQPPKFEYKARHVDRRGSQLYGLSTRCIVL